MMHGSTVISGSAAPTQNRLRVLGVPLLTDERLRAMGEGRGSAGGEGRQPEGGGGGGGADNSDARRALGAVGAQRYHGNSKGVRAPNPGR